MEHLPPSPGLALVTGGAWSGKTDYVVHWLTQQGRLTWIATADAHDPELQALLEHQGSTRPPSWKTLSGALSLPEIIRSQSAETQPIVVDSVSLWLGNLTARSVGRHTPEQTREVLAESTSDFLDAIDLQVKHRPVVIVSADMGMSVAPSDPMAYELRRAVGLLNQTLGRQSQLVVKLVCGIGTIIKAPHSSHKNK
ncbi:MAG: bifunctional adenosylcobinamide kinase/adenosylcobinamide-phosphate guanylyltransferase [Proteobacteria bacterium]|nr:bifunctional adenosylcobinamide kinase/adenosylcobinamide-phosphate guanylyltransferase [Pseudomonadota bacterium]